jgi:hypothetical protein
MARTNHLLQMPVVPDALPHVDKRAAISAVYGSRAFCFRQLDPRIVFLFGVCKRDQDALRHGAEQVNGTSTATTLGNFRKPFECQCNIVQIGPENTGSHTNISKSQTKATKLEP